MNQKTRFSLWYVMLALVGVFMLHDAWTETRSTEPIPYSEFQRLLKEGKITTARASSVLPVPGGPTSRMPLGMRARLLLEKETLDTADLERLFSSLKPAPATFTPAAAPCGERNPTAAVQGNVS
jgi:hypothetical protein